MTEEEYEKCLAEIMQLAALDPYPDCKDGERLLFLAGIIEEYEREHFPEWAT